jgi:hypothetical protein
MLARPRLGSRTNGRPERSAPGERPPVPTRVGHLMTPVPGGTPDGLHPRPVRQRPARLPAASPGGTAPPSSAVTVENSSAGPALCTGVTDDQVTLLAPRSHRRPSAELRRGPADERLSAMSRARPEAPRGVRARRRRSSLSGILRRPAARQSLAVKSRWHLSTASLYLIGHRALPPWLAPARPSDQRHRRRVERPVRRPPIWGGSAPSAGTR